MEKLLSLLKSRKFWAAVVGLVMLFVKELSPDFPLDEEQLTNVVYLLMAYILGVAFEEGLKNTQA
jgi:uncharacterized membrane protein